MKLQLLQENLNVQPLLHALNCHPELWDTNTRRTDPKWSAHHGLSDIYVRFAPSDAEFDKPHFSMWGTGAALLPVKDLCYDLMRAFEGEVLGGVLITRIPPGASVKPHIDKGWHPEFYQKFAVQVQAHPQQFFGVEDEVLVTKAGDLFTFDNSHTHWVQNDSPIDRITLIACIRTEWRPSCHME